MRHQNPPRAFAESVVAWVFKPQLWSEKQIRGVVNSGKNVDLAPDGKRIVALVPVATTEAQKAQNQVIFLGHFFDEVRRKVPTGK